MKEFIGQNMATALQKLGIDAKMTYSGDIGYWKPLEVWEIDENNREKLCDVTDEQWDSINCEDSWWRGSDGCNIGTVDCEMTINGQKIQAWHDEWRIDDLRDEYDSLDPYEQSEYEGNGGVQAYIDENVNNCYDNLLNYFCEEFGISTSRNVCAIAVELARHNEITMAELFRKYGGSK